jgi:hypothetical protein
MAKLEDRDRASCGGASAEPEGTAPMSGPTVAPGLDMTDPPLVSCLMVTQPGRDELAAVALGCHAAQTYPNLELVVVVQDRELAERYSEAARADGRRWRIGVARPDLTLGELRNIAVSMSMGPYACQWDDDDWYHPERVEAQLGHLVAAEEAMWALQGPPADGKHHVDACVLRRWTMCWPERGRYHVSWENDWPGTLLARTGALRGRYPAQGTAEDSAVLRGLRVARLDRPELYLYRVHGQNTWPTSHFETLFDFRGGTPPLSDDEARACRAKLEPWWRP